MTSELQLSTADLHCVRSNSNSTDCLVIYDWDDTILPTSWLRSLGFLSNNIADMVGTPPPALPLQVANLMRMIEEAAISNLLASSKKGRVVIVTNSSVLWVPFTAKRFFPRLSKIVESGFEVYSARPAQAENAGPNYVYLPSMAVTWKTDKFKELVGSTQFPTCVSVGDGFAERCAVLAIASSRMSGKAVRYPLQPSGTALLEQLQSTLGSLNEILNDPRTGDLYLNVQSGSYRIIPVQPTPDVIPLKMDDATGPVSSRNDNAVGIMQTLAHGIAQYGRTLSSKMSINKAGGPTAEVKKQPLVTTLITNKSSADEENRGASAPASILVQARDSSRAL